MNLSLDFPDPNAESGQLGLSRRADLDAAIARLRAWMNEPNSPIRAIRHQPARPGQFADMPGRDRARIAQGAGRERASGNSTRIRPLPSIACSAARTWWSSRPTASGKTLCYNLPVLHRLASGSRGARALSVPHQGAGRGSAARVPRRSWRRWDRSIRAFTYDGDTPQDARKAIRERANVVLTNPDMLHAGHPAAPHQVGEAVREPALHRHRRAALLSRRLRQPPGQRAAPAAADLRVLRLNAAVHLLLGDDRESDANWPRR